MFNVLENDFIFESKRFSNKDYNGINIELKGNICKVKEGSKDNGATLARDENAKFAWSFHDNAYCDKNIPLTRLQIDLIMLDLLKMEKFAWFRYKFIQKIFPKYKGFTFMRYIYFIGVRLFAGSKNAK